MKIVFLSNYFNHHQKPFSDAMDELTEHNYYFIATEEMTEERKQLGWGMEDFPPYVKDINRNREEQAECVRLIDEADVVLFGSMPEKLLKNRIRKYKLTIRYSERLLKVKPPFWKDLLKKVVYPFRNNKKNCYLLCASAYTAVDYRHYGCYKNKAYKWGYFPEFKEYQNIEELIERKENHSILWAGRFIDWKHPEIPLILAKKLKEDGHNFHLNIIGTGIMEQELKQKATELELNDVITFLGAMKPTQVREYMEKSKIFLFTSDRNEGWGAVLNESMNSGCAVVANQAIGSVPFLLENETNGFIYKDGDVKDLYQKIEKLLEENETSRRLGLEAYRTIQRKWNAKEAAKRLLLWIEDVLKEGASFRYENGPCSKAEILKDDGKLIK